MASDRPLNWGVVSTARINDEVIPQLEASGHANLLAVASRDSRRARNYADQHGIPVSYGSYGELFCDPEIDCVYISTPNNSHAWLSAQAMEAGKHVLCEKPLANSATEAAWLFGVAERAGVQLMEAFMYRHHDKTLALRRLLESDELGEVIVIRSWFHFRAADPGSDVRFKPELAGGSLRDIGSYCTGMAQFLLGQEPADVAGNALVGGSGVDEAFSGSLRFRSGALATFDCSMNAELDLGVTVVGTKARAHVGSPWYPHLAPHVITIEDAGGRRELPTSGVNSYLLEIDNLCAAARGEAQPTVTRDETLRNLTTLDRLAVAARLPNFELDPKGVTRR